MPFLFMDVFPVVSGCGAAFVAAVAFCAVGGGKFLAAPAARLLQNGRRWAVIGISAPAAAVGGDQFLYGASFARGTGATMAGEEYVITAPVMLPVAEEKAAAGARMQTRHKEIPLERQLLVVAVQQGKIGICGDDRRLIGRRRGGTAGIAFGAALAFAKVDIIGHHFGGTAFIAVFIRPGANLQAAGDNHHGAFSHIFGDKFGSLSPRDTVDKIRFLFAVPAGKVPVYGDGKIDNGDAGTGGAVLRVTDKPAHNCDVI